MSVWFPFEVSWRVHKALGPADSTTQAPVSLTRASRKERRTNWRPDLGDQRWVRSSPQRGASVGPMGVQCSSPGVAGASLPLSDLLLGWGGHKHNLLGKVNRGCLLGESVEKMEAAEVQNCGRLKSGDKSGLDTPGGGTQGRFAKGGRTVKLMVLEEQLVRAVKGWLWVSRTPLGRFCS